MMRHQLYKILFGALFGILAILLVGCGSSGDSSSDTPGDGSEPTPPSVFLELLNRDGQETRTISATEPGTIRVTVKTPLGESASHQFLTVMTTKGSFENSDGTAITNSEGVVEITLLAGDDNGAGLIEVTSGEASLDPPFAFQIGAPASIKIGSFINDVFHEGILTSSVPPGQTLSLGGTAEITAFLAILDKEIYAPYTKPVDVFFSTQCPSAVVDETVASLNGKVTTTYRADGCTSGSDTITAEVSIAGSKIQAMAGMDLAVPGIGSITFLSASPEHLALKGMSNPNSQTTSTILFQVEDRAANPVANALVNFSLSTTVGGILIDPLAAQTDSEGKVQVIVTSGDVPTSVRVHATVNDSQITTVSNNLVLSTGLPDQKSFSLSAETLNPEAWGLDGVAVNVTIRASDHFNNPAPDGTTVSFRTNGGVIDPTCSTENGVCSVEWRSQNPRPANGRAIILATALGEESFIDANGSGRYESAADIFNPEIDDMPEAFLDVNGNKIRDFDEEFLDYNDDDLYTDGNGIYNGTLCVEGCSNDLIHVRQDLVMVMASSLALISFSPGAVNLNNGLVPVRLMVEDINKNSMPGGTKVEITVPENAEIVGESSFEIPDNVTGPIVFAFALKNSDDTSDSGTEGLLQVKVTSPGGTITTKSIVCATP